MQVRFWGTRGSLPVAASAHAVADKVAQALLAANGRSFADHAAARAFVEDELPFAVGRTYGGSSSCVEIETDGSAFFICDMGSGLREFSLNAMRRCAGGHPRRYNFFLSHLHWDHIMGFPFFAAAFDPQAEVIIHTGHEDAARALHRQQEEISFPVAFDWLRARISFKHCVPGVEYEANGLRFSLIEQRHSHVSYGFRFTDTAGRSVVYSTDSEHKIDGIDHEDRIVEFFGGADLVICDTMYSLADAVSMKEDWGHSSNIVAIDLCHAARAKRLALFHHEPIYGDAEIEQLHRDSIRYEELTRADEPLEVLCAYDGLSVPI